MNQNYNTDVKEDLNFIDFELEDKLDTYLANFFEKLGDKINAEDYLRLISSAEYSESIVSSLDNIYFLIKWLSKLSSMDDVIAFKELSLLLYMLGGGRAGCSQSFSIAQFFQDALTLEKSNDKYYLSRSVIKAVVGHDKSSDILLPVYVGDDVTYSLIIASEQLKDASFQKRKCQYVNNAFACDVVLPEKCEVTLNKCEDAPAYVYKVVLLYVAYVSGILKTATDSSFDYASKRKAFDKPIIQHQLVSQRLADMLIDIEAVRLLMMQIASNLEYGEIDSDNMKVLVNHIGRISHSVASDAIQIYSAKAYIGDEERIRNIYKYIHSTTLWMQLKDLSETIYA